MKISLVRFAQPFSVGKSLDVRSSLEDGERVLGDPIHLHYYNDVFLRVDFVDGKYSQLIPWSQISTVLYSEETKKK